MNRALWVGLTVLGTVAAFLTSFSTGRALTTWLVNRYLCVDVGAHR